MKEGRTHWQFLFQFTIKLEECFFFLVLRRYFQHVSIKHIITWIFDFEQTAISTATFRFDIILCLHLHTHTSHNLLEIWIYILCLVGAFKTIWRKYLFQKITNEVNKMNSVQKDSAKWIYIVNCSLFKWRKKKWIKTHFSLKSTVDFTIHILSAAFHLFFLLFDCSSTEKHWC